MQDNAPASASVPALYPSLAPDPQPAPSRPSTAGSSRGSFFGFGGNASFPFLAERAHIYAHDISGAAKPADESASVQASPPPCPTSCLLRPSNLGCSPPCGRDSPGSSSATSTSSRRRWSSRCSAASFPPPPRPGTVLVHLLNPTETETDDSCTETSHTETGIGHSSAPGLLPP